VDTQIRLKDGQAVTVKQALPLPQGVSDYAVGGNRSFARKALSSFAAAPLATALKDKVQEESVDYKKEGLLTQEPEVDVSTGKGKYIEVKKVTATEGLSEKSIVELLKKHIRSFNLCYREALGKSPDLKGKVVFKINVDPAGRVTKVNMDKGAKIDRKLEQCLVQAFKMLHFPTPTKGRNVVVTVTFVLI
jgi:Ca-activated chloride channel family protein